MTGVFNAGELKEAGMILLDIVRKKQPKKVVVASDPKDLRGMY
jgi:hypothetical protein